MDTSRRAAGLGLLAYGLGTPIAFFGIGSPGGDYKEDVVTQYISGGHVTTAIVLAYLGAFAALGLLPFGRWMRAELPSGGGIASGLAVAAAAAGVIGWFLVGGVAVAFAEGGAALAGVPHPVVYLLTQMSNVIAVCASAFLAGSALLIVARRAGIPGWLKGVTAVAGVAGLLMGFFFPAPLFWLGAVVLGISVLGARTGRSDTAGDREQRAAAPQPA